MTTELTLKELPPEEIELVKKRRVVDRLTERLADAEEAIADLQTELERFEARYTMEVGRLYAEQDEIDAQIAEEELKLVPDDEEIKKRVEELRRLAEESAARTKAAQEKEAEKWEPTAEARKTYHELARTIHPDLVLDAGEKERRHALMAELNQAYSSGDQERLRKLSGELRISPDTVTGGTIGDQLVRAIRQTAQIRKRLAEVEEEKRGAFASELYVLHQKAVSEDEAGRDLLKQMAERAKTHIAKSRRRLENLRNVNLSQEGYVKDKFGMDISDFRPS
jgi:SHS2 domain-containing protein